MVVIYTLTGPVTILALAAIAVSTRAGLAGLVTKNGPHGPTRLSSPLLPHSLTNNGQAFAGLSANTPFYSITTAIAMMAGRFGLAVPALFFAGYFAAQKSMPPTRGTLRTDSLSFAVLLTAFQIVVTALSYLPIITLGTLLERL